MNKNRATLSKGRSTWCVIFRHPVCPGPNGKDKLRVRRGLGTSDESQAQVLVDELNAILNDPEMWTMTSRERCEAKFDHRIVAAFYDHMQPESFDPWAIRDKTIPLPGGLEANDGYARVQVVGTTGAGKTTLVRQMLGTDPDSERFPSISAAKTTICDYEIILKDGDFQAVVTFIARNKVRQYISECVIAAIASKLDGAAERDIVRRFLVHSDLTFRLNYILGNPSTLQSDTDELSDDDEDAEQEFDCEASTISEEEKGELLTNLKQYISSIHALANKCEDSLKRIAVELNIDLNNSSKKDLEAVQELVEDQLLEDDGFHSLVDSVMDDVESRFMRLGDQLVRGREGWPIYWAFTSKDRKEFIRTMNQFSSNYAPAFGRLLTPLVEGIRITGPFAPEWCTGTMPKIVLMDGQGIGHTADSSSSLSTSITRRFQLADVIILVDNAAQPMQAAPCAVLQSLVASGHESKLVVTFTHFDEVKGDNLIGTDAKKDHVISSFDNAIHMIGKTYGREIEGTLRRLIAQRVVFLANIQKKLKDSAKFTRTELNRLIQCIEESTLPAKPIEYKPMYDIANLVLAVQKATQEFHDRWHGLLGMGSRSCVAPEHWARVKALTRRLGFFSGPDDDQYGMLMPVADLIKLLQIQISLFLSNPLSWKPETPPQDSEEKQRAIDLIKQKVFSKLHGLSKHRVKDNFIGKWVDAYEHRGTGSTRIRARDVVTLYELAAPVPNEMPDSDENKFLFEIRALIAESVKEGGGKLRDWS